MTLLRFRVANHRSIRDEQALSLVSVPRRGQPRPRATQIPDTVRVAGIYGANASGKSNVLDALRYMLGCVRNSQTGWRPDQPIPRQPFKLNAEQRTRPSFYELDFVLDGVRHSYGFELDDEAVRGEWLFSFPHGKPRRLFERTGPHSGDYQFGRSLTGQNSQIAKLTRANSLFLSSAANNDHPVLRPIHQWLCSSIRLARQTQFDEVARLRIAKTFLAHPQSSSAIQRLMRVADLGISKVEVRRSELRAEERELIQKILEYEPGVASLSLEEDLATALHFTHDGGDASATLDMDEESDGTKSWLSLIAFLIRSVSEQSVLLVDEVDSSLHPHLSSTIIRMFKDADINPLGSQLVFASHDTTLLGSMLNDRVLERDEVWFTEKDATGATSLYSLDEFVPKKDENYERGYLQGRYGAVPHLGFEKIKAIFRELRTESDEPSAQSPKPRPEVADVTAEEAAAHRL